MFRLLARGSGWTLYELKHSLQKQWSRFPGFEYMDDTLADTPQDENSHLRYHQCLILNVG